MKKLIVVLVVVCLIPFIKSGAQVVSSGKASILINNIPKPAMPIVFEPNTLKTTDSKEPALGTGKYYALVIGIDKYVDPQINQLDFCFRDANAFYNTLTKNYTFDKGNVLLLKDATYDDIQNALETFAKKVTPSDNFLIFYAGHGYWNPTSETGFWIPSDGQKSSTRRWFRNSVLRDFLKEINSRHTLLISDACFSGGIFKTRAAFADASAAINKLYESPSRKAMTSGNLAEVPDQSVFLKYLIDKLEKNSEKYLSSEQLFSSFRMAVMNNSETEPRYGEIKDVGDEGGDFIFIHK